MRIRSLKHDDLDALLDLYTHLHDSDDALPDRATVLQVWSDMLSNPMLHCLGIDVGDRLVSSCTLTITPNLTRGARPYGQIETVVTHSEHRKRGLGHALIRHALELAWEQRCYKVMLMTGRGDVHRFYEECGFRKDLKTGFVAYPP
jgi:GNAT superfamily N-acetyltransferase